MYNQKYNWSLNQSWINKYKDTYFTKVFLFFTNYGYYFSTDLYGKDNIEALRIDGIYDMLTSDIRAALVPIFYEKDEAKKVFFFHCFCYLSICEFVCPLCCSLSLVVCVNTPTAS